MAECTINTGVKLDIEKRIKETAKYDMTERVEYLPAHALEPSEIPTADFPLSDITNYEYVFGSESNWTSSKCSMNVRFSENHHAGYVDLIFSGQTLTFSYSPAVGIDVVDFVTAYIPVGTRNAQSKVLFSEDEPACVITQLPNTTVRATWLVGFINKEGEYEETETTVNTGIGQVQTPFGSGPLAPIIGKLEYEPQLHKFSDISVEFEEVE